MTPEEKYKKAHAKIKNDTELNNIWEIFLADKHLEDNKHIEIFDLIHGKAREKYCFLRAKYYAGLISKKEYLTKRMGDEGIFYYDTRLFELGLATQKMPQTKRDELGWKGLKLERQDFPPNKIPYVNFDRHLPTVRILLEGCDYIHKNYVPTLKNNWRIRSMIHVHSKEKSAYEALDYLKVPLTKIEIINFEKERDV